MKIGRPKAKASKIFNSQIAHKIASILKFVSSFFQQAAYDEDDKTRKSKEVETDYHDTLFVESYVLKPLDPTVEEQNQDGNTSDEAESNSSDVEEFAVKKSTNHKVFKGNNADAQKRLTRSADLKKTSSPPKLPVLTKVNIHNVPKGITITKTKKVAAIEKPVAGSTKNAEIETTSKKTTPKSSPDSKASGTQKFAVVKVKAEAKELSPKSVATDSTKRTEVQKVKLTKAQVAAMAKEGKIAVKDGQVFLRNGPTNKPK